MRRIILSAIMAIASFACINAQNNVSYSSTYGNLGNSYEASSLQSSSYGCVGLTNSSVRYQYGYTRADGTYVRGHYKTNNNTTNHDNLSTRGNYNFYTGSAGKRARDYSLGAYNYGSGHTIYTGSRGGQFYINSHGNKVYVPKR